MALNHDVPLCSLGFPLTGVLFKTDVQGGRVSFMDVLILVLWRYLRVALLHNFKTLIPIKAFGRLLG